MGKRKQPPTSGGDRDRDAAPKRFARDTLTGIAAAAVTTVVAWILQVIPWESAWWLVLALSCLFLAFTYLRSLRAAAPRPAAEAARRRGALFCGACIAAMAGAFGWTEFLGPLTYRTDPSEIALLLGRRRWISYDPRGYDPSARRFPDPASIRADLLHIRRAGFDGVITFSSEGTLAQIPALAHRLGLAVIMGVWNPADERELAAAAAQRRYVTGYSVGHNGLDGRYSFRQLERAVRRLRFRTRRPVTTTEMYDRYDEPAPTAAEIPGGGRERRLLRLGDWIFPDAHVSLRRTHALGDTVFASNAAAGAAETIMMAQRLVEQRPEADTPILLKMVMYPVAGAEGASTAEQQRFFHLLLENRRDASSPLPRDVRVAAHGAFDAPWKQGLTFYPWDAHTGLLDSLGAPRPAVHEIVRRTP